MPNAEPPEVVDEEGLYAVAPEQFIAARDALVKHLRSGGDKSGAVRVARLRRPPLTVWVLNRVSRATPEVIEALLDAGRELRVAMERALDGDASGLRRARDDERAAVGAVVNSAERRLSDGGYTATEVMRQRVAATLRAAIVDESVAARLRRGTLDQDHEAPGFGMDVLSVPLTLVRSPDRPESRSEPPEQQQRQPERAVGAGGDVDAARRSEVATPARPRQEAQHEADRLEAEASRLAGEAERLTSEAETRAADAKRRAVEAETLAAQAEELAADAKRLARAASDAEERAAAVRGHAEDARRAAEVARAAADRFSTT